NFWGATTVLPGDLKDVKVEAYKIQSYNDDNGNGRYDVGEIYTVDPQKGQVANLYRTWGPGNWKATKLIPFKFYDITSNPPRQLSVIVRDRNQNLQWDPHTNDTPYEYIFVLDSDYDSTGNNWNPTAGGRDFMDEINQNGGPVLWTFWWYPRGSREQFANDFTMEFYAPKVNTVKDTFVFVAQANSYSTELAKADVDKINVFPNPYYGYHYREVAPDNKYVTFSHLPDEATIRIFDLSGVLVKTIKHTAANGQFETWNLQNENNYPVASGVYVVHIDMPKLGKKKILKLVIIQEQQMLKVY
ncbi:MAG: T9SS type A sorting domain-containing protein, partial [Ignavibacteria bacterium]